MTKLHFSNKARGDLLEIWLYIAERNPSAADRVADVIEQRCQVLRNYPKLGAARPEITEEARALVIERWIVFYREIEGGVQVVRIVDASRDLILYNIITLYLHLTC